MNEVPSITKIPLSLIVEWAELIRSSDYHVGPFNLLTFVGTSLILALLFWLIPNYAARIVPSGLTLGLSPAVGDN